MINNIDGNVSMNSNEPTKRLLPKLWDWKDILMITILFIVLYIGSQVGLVLVLGLDADPFQLTIGSLLLTALATMVSMLGVNLLRKRHSFSALGLGSVSRRWINISIGIGIAAAIIRSGLIYALIELFPALNEGADALAEMLVFEEAWKMLVVGLLASLLVPVYEELFFRGFIHNALRNRFGMWVSIIISSLIFGVFHLIPAQIITAFLLGLVLGWLYEKSGSLWTVIIAHVVNNALALGASAIVAMLV